MKKLFISIVVLFVFISVSLSAEETVIRTIKTDQWQLQQIKTQQHGVKFTVVSIESNENRSWIYLIRVKGCIFYNQILYPTYNNSISLAKGKQLRAVVKLLGNDPKEINYLLNKTLALIEAPITRLQSLSKDEQKYFLAKAKLALKFSEDIFDTVTKGKALTDKQQEAITKRVYSSPDSFGLKTPKPQATKTDHWHLKPKDVVNNGVVSKGVTITSRKHSALIGIFKEGGVIFYHQSTLAHPLKVIGIAKGKKIKPTIKMLGRAPKKMISMVGKELALIKEDLTYLLPSKNRKKQFLKQAKLAFEFAEDIHSSVYQGKKLTAKQMEAITKRVQTSPDIFGLKKKGK